jgi:hypothetical protein
MSIYRKALEKIVLHTVESFPSVKNFRIPIHPDLHTKIDNNPVCVVDLISQFLVHQKIIDSGTIRFLINLETNVITIMFQNIRPYILSIEEDDPDMLTLDGSIIPIKDIKDVLTREKFIAFTTKYAKILETYLHTKEYESFVQSMMPFSKHIRKDYSSISITTLGC